MTKANKAIKASIILIFTKLSDKLLGLISTLILARILMPEDFGLIAISNLVIGLITRVTDSGGDAYLIQKDNIHNNDINTSWTINLILKIMLYLILISVTPFVVDYYNDDRLSLIIPVLSSMVILGALANPYISILKRNQSYELLFKIEIIRKTLTVGVVVASALYFQSYWALIIGHLVSNLIKGILSYIFIKYRPLLCIEKWQEQWVFSKWMLAKGCFGYARSQLDTFLVSSFYGPAQLGGYHLSKYISNMPASEGISPALDPLLASFSRSKHDIDNFRHQILLTLLVIGATVIPLSCYMYFNSMPIMNLLLGSKWLEFNEVFSVLSLLVIPVAIGRISGQIATSQGKVKMLFYYDVISLAGMAIILYLNSHLTLVEFASLKLAGDLVFVIILFLFVTKTLLAGQRGHILLTFVIIVLIGSLMGYASQFYYYENLPILLALAISFTVYAIGWLTFCVVLYKLFLNKSSAASHLKFIIFEFYKRLSLLVISNILKYKRDFK